MPNGRSRYDHSNGLVKSKKSNKHAKNNDIWYAYLRAHLDERTRNLHYAGTLLGIGIIFSAIIAQEPLLALIGLLTAYGLAWFDHFTIEKINPLLLRNRFYLFCIISKCFGFVSKEKWMLNLKLQLERKNRLNF